ncbi:alpha/beta hydrolase [Pseudomonas fluorescens]|uniref:alpha/beta fold hydrolase n=1 Tax=Pseudomonas TaxID=286 RepID=UPI0005DDF00A|nr:MULTISPECIES: alpha/beta hydrolase [Pseudomonas]KJH88475.1 alpha/beta hydrolase [Pseudomonas fluorescens]TFF53686.1 alpha/beta hydrolase [Pseudomonas putida]
MSHPARFTHEKIPLNIEGVQLDLAVIHRRGPKAPILFLHGFGSTKEDYADITLQPVFDGHPFIAYDAPGCGETECSDLSRINIPFLVKTAQAVLKYFEIDTFHLVGHSMGGLTSLMLAHGDSSRVLSFVDIEGNIAPEDCFLSRQIHDHRRDDDARFFRDFIERTRLASDPASALYAASLAHKVRPGAVRGIFESMVDLSDNGQLMEKFLALPFPRQYMYGVTNSHLSYLKDIATQGVHLACIPDCGHFPMYSNPVLMWQQIKSLQDLA